jgi:hypothetical protein
LAAKSNIKLVDRDELQKYLEDYNQARIEGYEGSDSNSTGYFSSESERTPLLDN